MNKDSKIFTITQITEQFEVFNTSNLCNPQIISGIISVISNDLYTGDDLVTLTFIEKQPQNVSFFC